MKILFLDLENTVIDSWENMVVLNNKNIRKMIESIQPEKIGIYSFAIWNEKDKEVFKNMLLEDLEKIYNITIDLDYLFSVEEILRINGIDFRIKPVEFIRLFSKEFSFIQFSKKKFQNHEIFLIDDMVENTFWETKNLKINLLNPILHFNKILIP